MRCGEAVPANLPDALQALDASHVERADNAHGAHKVVELDQVLQHSNEVADHDSTRFVGWRAQDATGSPAAEAIEPLCVFSAEM